MPQQKTPLYTALINHIDKVPSSFHVPGHKNGAVFPQFAKKEFEAVLRIDATEITGLDDFHDPTTVIQEAQHLLTQLYGAKKSYFLVNGSTVGNLAMILSVCDVGDVVLVQRNCHKSILNGLELSGAKPVFLAPIFDESVGVPTYIPYETIKEAIEKYPSAKAIILTNPNYYGMAVDLTAVIGLAHQFHIPVLVDEAHGAHFILQSPFPKSAIQCGADIVVNSAHKTLPAMTMGSYIHFNSKFIEQNRLSHYLKVLQSSSPSYPIMASLDLARYYVANLSEQQVKIIENEVTSFKNELNNIEQIEVVETKDTKIMTDLLKVTIQSRCSLSGYQLQALFEEQNIYTELADPYNVLLVLPLAINQQYNQIVKKIKAALSSYNIEGEPIKTTPIRANYSVLPICYKDIKRYNKIEMNFKDSVGRLAGQMVIPYPPGIPLIMIGEMITEVHINQLQELLQLGAKIQGINEKNNIEVFEV